MLCFSWLGGFFERLVRSSQSCEDYFNLWRLIVMEEEMYSAQHLILHEE
jgi:hypothetical protein